MKGSIYNFFVPYKDRVICFNGVSGKVFSVSKGDEFNKVKQYIEAPDGRNNLTNFMVKNNFNEYPCLYLKNPLNLLNYNKLLRQTKLFVSCYLSGKYIYLRYICEHSLYNTKRSLSCNVQYLQRSNPFLLENHRISLSAGLYDAG